MARLPKSMSSTPEEDKFFEDQRAAQAAEDVEEQEAAAPEAEEEVVEAPEEPSEEAEEVSPDAPDAEAQEGRRVPIGELYAEREKRKELQSKIAQLETTFSRVMERMNAGQPQGQQQPSQQQQLPEIPAYDVDPVAHLKARVDLLQQAAGGHQQVLSQQAAVHQFQTALAGLENQFRQATPDYDDAVAFAKQAREAELAALGYDPAQRVEILRNEILQTSAFAMQQGRNPAEAFYSYAKARGYGAGNGQQRPVASASKPASKLATVAKAQAAARSLPKGGSAPPPAVTLEALAQMDDDEFDKNFDRFWRKT